MQDKTEGESTKSLACSLQNCQVYERSRKRLKDKEHERQRDALPG